MKLDVEIHTDVLGDVPALARRAEGYAFDCVWVDETRHDPFVLLALAASNTKRISVGSSIALAFTRSPTTIAYTAWDLQGLSRGRLILGLGSQVKGHIERRFGMRWESPAPKMREVVMALRAVWAAWEGKERLDFRGRFYKLDLMTPFFTPPPVDKPRIPVYLAGVNRGMCKVAAGVGDGFLVHPLHTIRYLREVLAPTLAVGLKKAGRKRDDIAVAASVFAAAGDNESEIRQAKNLCREQIAFYASTRTYRSVLELHGWGDVCDRLHEHTVRGEWDRMAGEVGDDILNGFVVEGTWKEMGRLLLKRYEGLADRIRIYIPFDGTEKWRTLAAGFRV